MGLFAEYDIAVDSNAYLAPSTVVASCHPTLACLTDWLILPFLSSLGKAKVGLSRSGEIEYRTSSTPAGLGSGIIVIKIQAVPPSGWEPNSHPLRDRRLGWPTLVPPRLRPSYLLAE